MPLWATNSKGCALCALFSLFHKTLPESRSRGEFYIWKKSAQSAHFDGDWDTSPSFILRITIGITTMNWSVT
jgi:hypothetical protein